MPKYDVLYPRKEPLLQMKILKSIALAGRLSQTEAAEEIGCKAPTISEAFKIMINRTKLIQITEPPADAGRQSKRERFYKLSAQGLSTFIKKNPSPDEFWAAIIWYGNLNPESPDRDEFNRYYTLFIEKFIGEFTLRSCFFLGNLFENLLQRYRKQFEYNSNDYGHLGMFPHGSMQEKIRKETTSTCNVLECLLLNRGITIDKIIELTKLEEKEVRKVIEDYSMTKTRYSQYIDDYNAYGTSKYENITIGFLNNLVIVPVRTQEDNNQDKIYELSLLGILLVLATITSKRIEEDKTYFSHFDTAARNYQEKLPLVFGKWKLLKQTLDFYQFSSLFDYLFGDYKSEILSLSVSLGGNKEIYDNIRAAGFRTISKFSTIHDEGVHALESVDYPEEFRNTAYYRFIQEKINEIEISLRYSDLLSFGRYMISRKKEVESNLDRISITFEDDLQIIEESLADKFSFLFYIGQLRENSHLASYYPITASSIQPDIGHVYPKGFLNQIVFADDQIRNKLREWIKESKSFQQLALEKMDDIYLKYSRKVATI
jgi:hypothetical protein